VPLCPAICRGGKARAPVPHGVGVTTVVYFLPQETETKRGEGTGEEEIGTVQVLLKSLKKGEGKGRREEKGKKTTLRPPAPL